MRIINRLTPWRQPPEVTRRVAELRMSNPGEVVMLGDSITEHAPWSEILPQVPLCNHGVAGDTTAGVLARLPLVRPGAAQLHVLIGTNDISRGVSDPTICASIDAIVQRLTQLSPSVTLHSIMPRTARYAIRIRRLNTRLEQVANARGAIYVDLWPVLADAQGALRTEYTEDHLHLTPRGYEAWAEVLRPMLPHS